MLVLETVMLCSVEVEPGTLRKMSAFGFKETPGSGDPYAVNDADAVGVAEEMLRVPEAGPRVWGA
jgi:hypothetical protein